MRVPFLDRLMPKRQARQLDAAGGGRRWADDRRLSSPGTLHAAAATVAMRAQHFATNTAIGARLVESLVGNLVGDGISPRSEHPTQSVRKALQAAFKNWVVVADADGRRDFFGLQQDAARDLITFGEFLFVIVPEPETGEPRLRRLHPEQLDRSITRPTGSAGAAGGVIIQGVEFDAFGRVAAYWLRQFGPGDPLANMANAARRYEASSVLHSFRHLYPGQVRGLSWLAPVLLTANDYDALTDAMIERAKVAALHVGFIRDGDAATPYTGEQSGGTLVASMEPGALVTLPPGKDIEFTDVPDQNGAIELLRHTLRQIAAGVGATYEMISGDYSQVNYSSARAGMLEFRRFASGVQFHQLVFPFCRPIWKRFAAYQAFTGAVDRLEYAANPLPFEQAKWLPPKWGGVDPQKDAAAAEIELRNRFRSRADIIAERGYDIEDVDAEIDADKGAAPVTTAENSNAG